MAQLLISHKFESVLHMKLHTRQGQANSTRLDWAYKFSIESDQKNGNARCFKKGCLKIQYRAK